MCFLCVLILIDVVTITTMAKTITKKQKKKQANNVATTFLNNRYATAL
ncbi:hypothetical protein DPX39_090060900 [Trypanosoma brucei equiperdum]|uniref:Uncharacterized protein n=1 Tax=Trypanosoma brucei equiperdum TaxID=630700 RepID=A0A3L6L190_9TRYP|nr:hypothetical protein DPX39_090060900 [Trypanosoma brucei equiperdum]